MAVSTFLFLSLSDFVAVRRNNTIKPISFIGCPGVYVSSWWWQEVATQKNARILI